MGWGTVKDKEQSQSIVSSALGTGTSHWRKSAACPKCDMVWLNRSHIPVGKSAFPRGQKGGRGSAPCGNSVGRGTEKTRSSGKGATMRDEQKL